MPSNQNVASEETNLTFVHTLLQSTMDKIPTTDATGANHLEAFTIVGPIILIVISSVVVYLIVSFVKFRLDRQQRRKEALVTTAPTTGHARMLAYSLPYNVLHVNRALANYRRPSIVDGSLAASTATASVEGPRGKAKDPSSCPVVETPRPALVQLAVKPTADGYTSASFLGSSDGGSLNDLSGCGGGVRRRSPVPAESKSRLKRLKKRRIQPFGILDDFKRREKQDPSSVEGATGEGGGGGGIMFINQYYGYESSSTATSTFQMRLDQR